MTSVHVKHGGGGLSALYGWPSIISFCGMLCYIRLPTNNDLPNRLYDTFLIERLNMSSLVLTTQSHEELSSYHVLAYKPSWRR